MSVLSHISDLHVGALRSGGTTPASAMALRRYLLDQTEDLLSRIDSDLLVNGDLFDTFNIPLSDLLHAVQIFDVWLKRNRTCKIYLSQGNHDMHSNSNLVSSFLFFGRLLTRLHGEQVVLITEPMSINKHWHVIPHMMNQDLFDQALSRVPECDVLFLHANYDNHFAVQSDHSLNVTEAQARSIPAGKIVFAHEHHDRIGCGGKVFVCGNQIASSVADCLSRQPKQYLVVTDGLLRTETLGLPPYVEMAWDALQPSEAKFVRVSGTATAEQAPAVVSAISRYRSASDAFVVSNAVQIQSEDGSEVFEAALEQATSFNVLAALKELLTPEEWAVVEKVYK